jgi:hypothetical protein
MPTVLWSNPRPFRPAGKMVTVISSRTTSRLRGRGSDSHTAAAGRSRNSASGSGWSAG